jgi:hypothetical protein
MATEINPLVVSDKISYTPFPSSCHLDEGRARQIRIHEVFPVRMEYGISYSLTLLYVQPY